MATLRRESPAYIIGFAALVCLVCALPIASAAVGLRPRQAQNARIDRLTKVLSVSGLMSPDESLSADEIEARFSASVTPRAINITTGETVDSIDVVTYDQRAAASDPARSIAAPENAARVFRLPNVALVYEVVRDGSLQSIILPIQGYGLWSTMYGYLALERDARTVAGITFYEHGETAGLGGEIENPRWQARWVGRQALDDNGTVQLKIIKGAAGSPADDPYQVDGLSGATITGRGVTATIDFWLGPNGFGPYLDRMRAPAPARNP
jgi:Na+-transporting NADH:ubiquinone oxidoreductase subunit C